MSNSPLGRRASVTSELSFSSLWWDTCGENLEIADENDGNKANGTAKVKQWENWLL